MLKLKEQANLQQPWQIAMTICHRDASSAEFQPKES
jgi:hypothetical protein